MFLDLVHIKISRNARLRRLLTPGPGQCLALPTDPADVITLSANAQAAANTERKFPGDSDRRSDSGSGQFPSQ